MLPGLPFFPARSQDARRMTTWLYKHLARPRLFAQDAEEMHDLAVHWLSTAASSRLGCNAAEAFFQSPPLPCECMGLRFPNPVGLAAGMDKRAAAVPIWSRLGFGFSELGGVTLHGQPGNPKPRMFRAPSELAVVNRMGFNNPGAEAFAANLRGWKTSGLWPNHPVGINLGKSKTTPLEQAADDYVGSFLLTKDLADFFVVNVSSPNTPNLRQLQDKSALEQILQAIRAVNQPAKPVLVKVAPDLSFEALDEILDLALTCGLSGIVATNTTIARPSVLNARARKVYAETGGLSGAPMRERSTEIVRHLYRQAGGRLAIIGVGGIFTAQDAWEKIAAGASLVQIYTGMVYEGPGIASDIVEGLADLCDARGFKDISAVVGSEARG